ncbi:MAG: transposase [Sandaracinaceae bacterium]
MTISRAQQVDLAATPYYHLVSRCVRRAFLCGRDPHSGRDYGHRKRWLVERLRELGDVFAVEVCAYAVMSNHYHVVLRVVAEAAAGWSADEVVERYGRLFKNVAGQLEGLTDEQRDERLELWRERLTSISWLMRTLNEYLARRANKEDGCTGRFWEGRFKSQALLDEAALLTCMSYVDLNPVRAGAAPRLDDAEHTSIRERLAAMGTRLDAAEAELASESDAPESGSPSDAAEVELSAEAPGEDGQAATAATGRRGAGAGREAAPAKSALETEVGWHRLVPFADEPNRTGSEALPMTLVDYAELLDWTGRAHREGMARLSGPRPQLLQRRGIDPEAWLRMTMAGPGFEHLAAFGTEANLKERAARTDRAWCKGQRVARRLFSAEVEQASFAAA